DLDRLDHGHRVAFEVLGLLITVKLERAQPTRFGHRLHVAHRVVPEDADRRHERRERAHDRRDLLRCHEARRVLDEDEPERVRAGGAARNPPPGAPRFAARAHDRLHHAFTSFNSRILLGTSVARTRPSPTSTAWAPADTTRRTSAPVKNPLSLTTMGPGGIDG